MWVYFHEPQAEDKQYLTPLRKRPSLPHWAFIQPDQPRTHSTNCPKKDTVLYQRRKLFELSRFIQSHNSAEKHFFLAATELSAASKTDQVYNGNFRSCFGFWGEVEEQQIERQFSIVNMCLIAHTLKPASSSEMFFPFLRSFKRDIFLIKTQGKVEVIRAENSSYSEQ